MWYELQWSLHWYRDSILGQLQCHILLTLFNSKCKLQSVFYLQIFQWLLIKTTNNNIPRSSYQMKLIKLSKRRGHKVYKGVILAGVHCLLMVSLYCIRWKWQMVVEAPWRHSYHPLGRIISWDLHNRFLLNFTSNNYPKDNLYTRNMENNFFVELF